MVCFFFLVWLMVFKSLGLANLSNMWPEESTWCSLPQQKHMGILCRSTPVLLAQLQRSGLLSKTCIRAKQREILSISQEIKGSGCGMRKREHCKENIKRVNQDIHSTSLSSCQAPGLHSGIRILPIKFFQLFVGAGKRKTYFKTFDLCKHTPSTNPFTCVPKGSAAHALFMFPL